MEPVSPRHRLVSDHCVDCLPEASGAELLVSVRDLREAQMAVSGQVGIVDFKEPSQGALAACESSVWRSAVERFEASLRLGRVRLSAALGEPGTGEELSSQVPREFSFAKIGPSRCTTTEKLAAAWEATCLPESVELVPVAYADHVEAETICPEQVLELVVDSGHQRLLVDTFTKDGRTLTDHISIQRLLSLIKTASRHGVWLALAGSIRLQEMQDLVAKGVHPKCWGVRGDVCDQRDRRGGLDATRVAAWQDACRRACSSACT